MNRKLTLNLGTRRNYFPVPTRADRGLERYWFPGTGDANLDNRVWVCGVGSVPKDCGVKVSKKLFAPSIGIAYRVTDTFVIRTGYGINTDPWNVARPMRANHPLLTALTINAPNSYSWTGTLREGIPVLTEPDLGNGVVDIPPTVVVNTMDTGFRRGYIQSWNFTLQKQLGGGWVAQAGYVATRQTGIMGFEERNYGLVGGGGHPGRPADQRPVQLLLGQPVQRDLLGLVAERAGEQPAGRPGQGRGQKRSAAWAVARPSMTGRRSRRCVRPASGLRASTACWGPGW